MKIHIIQVSLHTVRNELSYAAYLLSIYIHTYVDMKEKLLFPIFIKIIFVKSEKYTTSHLQHLLNEGKKIKCPFNKLV